MKTTILQTAEAHFDAATALMSWASEIQLSCAWATSAEGTAAHWKLLPLAKLRRTIIGVEFAQTEPWVLRTLQALGTLKVGGGNGTFHPKLYLGTKGQKARAIVGSANFTAAAFGSNTELSVLLEGNLSDQPFQELLSALEAHWSTGLTINEPWLQTYTSVWKRRPQAPSLPQIKYDVSTPHSLALAWPEYLQLLKNQENRTPAIRVFQDGPSYTRELDQIAALFKQRPHVADMTPSERSLLLGLPGHSTGLIGSMSAARFAKERMRDQPASIGAHLDTIPLRGPVPTTLIVKVLDGLMGLEGIKLGVATRLLTVKRPDIFVSVNKGSSPQLATMMAQPKIKTTTQYMQLLHAVWQLPWYQSVRPNDPMEAKTWDRRTALLDAVLYEHVPPTK